MAGQSMRSSSRRKKSTGEASKLHTNIYPRPHRSVSAIVRLFLVTSCFHLDEDQSLLFRTKCRRYYTGLPSPYRPQSHLVVRHDPIIIHVQEVLGREVEELRILQQHFVAGLREDQLARVGDPSCDRVGLVAFYRRVVITWQRRTAEDGQRLDGRRMGMRYDV